MACMAGAPVKVKSGMYIHEPDRNPKHRLRSNCNGTSGLPRSTDTTSPPFLVRKITIGDIHFYISISFSISSSHLTAFLLDRHLQMSLNVQDP